jgi:hypothetical protein
VTSFAKQVEACAEYPAEGPPGRGHRPLVLDEWEAKTAEPAGVGLCCFSEPNDRGGEGVAVTGSALVGLLIGLLAAARGLARSFGRRHEPAPPNHWTKLPFMLLLIGLCVWFAVDGIASTVFAVLAVVGLCQVALILDGRNPWWMQSPWDRLQEPVDRTEKGRSL